MADPPLTVAGCCSLFTLLLLMAEPDFTPARKTPLNSFPLQKFLSREKSAYHPMPLYKRFVACNNTYKHNQYTRTQHMCGVILVPDMEGEVGTELAAVIADDDVDVLGEDRVRV